MRFKPRAVTVKLGLFALVMVLILGMLGVVFSQMRFARENGYHAVFTSSSGILPGAQVRIAGVPVGSVSQVSVGDDNLAHIEFDVDRKYRLYKSTEATVRYENLVGDRYLELLEGPGSAEVLAAGGTIPVEQTKPALDLDLLLGGFKPLLRGLNPAQVNDLTGALLKIFQGQGGTLVSLLNSSGSFTKTLADRDALIGSVIENLKTVLSTIDERDEQFATTLDELQRLISGLAADKDPIGDAIPRLAGATGDLTELLQTARPDLKNTITELGRTAQNLNDNSGELQWIFENLPETYKKLVRIGAYGSFLNIYVCAADIMVDGPDGKPMLLKPPGAQTTGRCAK
ncbi:MCE family protein [Nocardia cyriacigeorgica]|uniref:MCE family protein n=1 Tax=Nocardia cyriacigeorgica TaxID=135487 RepID=A0A6P1D4I9_9NOCA|nr:MCE family protein [Nocardia cyriacigeorgica]NEW38778.1 MCE family protein [Nocardia cyriacigeorgica]NEW44439.1 MCE family protein [Nocardia cyriacigeorgica]NEW52811.1 MCE family protein [Nocardia cyriacigeorgica]NEW56833.1 MCE family protein [Nocardia cyriacigeorgica]